MEEQPNILDRRQKRKNMFKNLTWQEHLAAGWPLLLITIGGLAGGLCGGLAYGLNVKLFNSKLKKSSKYLFSFLIGIGGCLLYILIILIIIKLFPGIFAYRG